jgi:hypothetical protein
MLFSLRAFWRGQCRTGPRLSGEKNIASNAACGALAQRPDYTAIRGDLQDQPGEAAGAAGRRLSCLQYVSFSQSVVYLLSRNDDMSQAAVAACLVSFVFHLRLASMLVEQAW